MKSSTGRRTQAVLPKYLCGDPEVSWGHVVLFGASVYWYPNASFTSGVLGQGEISNGSGQGAPAAARRCSQEYLKKANLAVHAANGPNRYTSHTTGWPCCAELSVLFGRMGSCAIWNEWKLGRVFEETSARRAHDRTSRVTAEPFEFQLIDSKCCGAVRRMPPREGVEVMASLHAFLCVWSPRL